VNNKTKMSYVFIVKAGRDEKMNSMTLTTTSVMMTRITTRIMKKERKEGRKEEYII